MPLGGDDGGGGGEDVMSSSTVLVVVPSTFPMIVVYGPAPNLSPVMEKRASPTRLCPVCAGNTCF